MLHIPHDETQTVEFKREFTPTVSKEVIAFANSEGGTLYVGVLDDGTPVGVEQPRETILQIANSLRDSVKPDVMPYVSIDAEAVDGKPIVVVHANRGTRRPYHLASKGPRPEGVFVRQGSSSVPASETAILAMIKESDGDSYEETLSLNQQLTFESAFQEFSLRDVPFAPEHMRTLGIVNAEGLFTNLGVLLSDQCPALIKAAALQGNKGDGSSIARDRKEFSGSLFKQLNEAYEYVDFRNETRTRLIGLHRDDERAYPEVALREVLVNAVVHRSYELNAPTLIKLYDDRLEITSPGGLPAGIEAEDLDLEVSVQRNPKLAHIFYRLQLIEAYGFGVQIMQAAYRGSGVKPTIDITPNFFRVTLPNTHVEKGVQESVVPLSAAVTIPANNGNPPMQPREVLALVQARGGSIKRIDVERAFGVSRSTAANLINQMVEARELVAVGEGPARRYALP